LAPAWGQTSENNPVPLKDLTPKNYDQAPGWERNNENSWGKRMLQNQSFGYLYDKRSN
jgi:hypothetical protein